MKQSIQESSFPLFQLELDINECRYDSVEQIADYFKQQIKAHQAAIYIATFDHYQHTQNLPEGQIADSINAAMNVVFCLGFSLQDPLQLATRPRSIGICEAQGKFFITFAETPMPVANTLMEQWSMSLSLQPPDAPPKYQQQEGQLLTV